MTEADQIAVVAAAPHKIRFIKNPTEAVQWAAVRQGGLYIQYISNPTENVQWYAIDDFMNLFNNSKVPLPTQFINVENIDVQVMTKWRIKHFEKYLRSRVRGKNKTKL